MSTLCPSSGGGTYSRFGVLTSLRKIKPCCGLSLQTGAKCVAIGQMVNSFLEVLISLHFVRKMLIQTGHNVFHLIQAKSLENGTHTKSDWEDLSFFTGVTDEEMFYWCCFIISVAAFCFDLFLYYSVQQKLVGKVTLWWRVMCFNALLTWVATLYMMIAGLEHGLGQAEGWLWCCIDLYSLWVIYEYIKELEASKETPAENENDPAVHFFENV